MELKCPARTTAAGNLRGDSSGFHGYDHPSFSSTLLDAIYRSIDDSSHDIRSSSRSRSQSRLRAAEEEIFFEEMLNGSRIGGNSTAAALMMKSSSTSLDRRSKVGNHEERKSRDRTFDRWMQNEDLVIRRRSLPPETTTEFAGLRSSVMSSDRRRSLGSMKVQSSPASSSESSSGGRFSSYTDSDILYSTKKKNSSLNPIRTSISDPRPPKSDSAGKSAKSRAMKLYGDLKRMKQPISPGGKLASFLNSLFNASGSSKKQRTSSAANFTSSTTTPSCSTASSYSRSCLSKRPSSADCVKRSVRFCPVNVIVEEDSRSSRKSAVAVEEKRRVEEMARDILRNYQQRRELEARKGLMNGGGDQDMAVDDDDDDDDDESCCSSDLFELEIGVDRYCEELPVYETTRVDTNRAITGRMIT